MQAQQPAAAGADASGSTRPAPAFDEARARELQQAVDRNKTDADGRVALANLYFDAERYSDAAKWYEQALVLRPRDVNVSTDLGVSYYYLNQPDRALKQFDYSLSVDPTHTKTILNLGIVRAFGSVFRVHGRAKIGRLFTTDFRELPPTMRWFAGGDRSVRGFGFNELSPTEQAFDKTTGAPVLDEQGNPVFIKTGGRHLLVGSVEVVRDLPRNFGIAFFVDGGNAINKLGDRLEYAAGIGFRWRLPVVTVGIDHDTGEIVYGPDLDSHGVMDDPTAVLDKAAEAVSAAINERASGRSDLGELQKTIRQETGRVIRAETARRPVIVPVVMEL